MTAEEKYKEWLNCDDEEIKAELCTMTKAEIEECFFKDIEFGTGGLRGIIGAGTNRMNIYTVRRATLGFAEYIKESNNAEKGIVIAYDNRRKSREFAEETAKVLSANGIRSFVFEALRPTPELSFAVRELKAFGGVVITASHNPPEYNGYKLYDENGCQLVPKYTDIIIDKINNIKSGLLVDMSGADANLINYIGKEIDEKYYQKVREIEVNPDIDKGDLKIVYSPQHGAGNIPVREVLKRSGFEVIPVEKQCNPDTEFSNTKNPNPETEESFEAAIETAKECGADLILVTDPDCDRLGAAVKNGENYLRMTGNQMGAVLLEYILTQKKIPENAVMINTIVTSDMGDLIAKKYGVEVEKTLTGFKFIGDKIQHHLNTDKKEFVFGYEESYGYLIGDFVRDKDAVQAALMVSEAAAYYKKYGKTLYDVLCELYDEHGYFSDKLISVTKPGQDGAREIREFMRSLRISPIEEAAGLKVTRTEDYMTENKASKDIPNADVIKIFLENGSWIAIRPSGTEPKCKFYFSAVGKDRTSSEALLDKMVNDINSILM